MLRRSLGRALAAGWRSRHASFAAASALARCAVGARTLALLLVVGYAAPQKLALCLQLPQPKLRERKLGKKERLNIVLVGKTGHGKSSLANILCGDKSKFPVSDDLSSVTSEIQYTDFEYKGHPVRVIDTPGFFDTTMPPEEIQHALSQFGDVAREGITALLVVVKKERLTAENAAVCEFVHCVLGDGALQKYGVMVMTHSGDATAALKQSLEALPAENYGAKMLGLVGGRLLSCEARAWRQSRIRDSVLQQVLEMHVQNDCHAADPEMLQWARIKQLEAAKLEEEMRPHLELLEARHAAAEAELKRSSEQVSEGREAAYQAQLSSLEAELGTLQAAAKHSFLDLGLYRRRGEIEAEIEAKQAAHAQQADEKLRALEAQLASSEAERREMRRMAVEAFKARQGEQQQNQAAAARQQLEEGGDFDYIKAAAHAAGMDEMDAKLKGAWEERTRDFGKSVGGACSIQ